MRLSYLVIPVAALAVLSVSALQAAFPGEWGPIEPKYQMIVDYHGTVLVLDRNLSQDDCRLALPYSDRLKQIAFTCEREG